MNRDFVVKIGLILLVVGLDIALMAGRGFSVPANHFLMPVGVLLLLTGVGVFYARRNVENFTLCMTGLAQVVAFTTGYTLLMYSAASLGVRLYDDPLMRFDEACGVSLPTIVDWARRHPGLTSALRIGYDSMLLQTALVIILLGFRSQRVPLEQFVLQFMTTALISAGVFAVMPAVGPFHGYGYEMSGDQGRYVEHLMAVRDGSMTEFTLQAAEGLITFPSFHTTWAILIAWAFRRDWWLAIPFGIVNIAVIISTLTTGWHYFADVVGGVVLAVIGIGMTTLLRSWFYEADGSPRRLSGSG